MSIKIRSSVSPARAKRWASSTLLAGLAVALRCQSGRCLEVIESKVDRDGGVLVIEDILEGFGFVPVSVQFSPVSEHMFIGFKEGQVRIYPDGGETEAAAVFDSCVAIEDEVSSYLADDPVTSVNVHVFSLLSVVFWR